MIITDKFVFVHEPKTGGSFVRKVLGQIHRQSNNQSFVTRISNKLSGQNSKTNYGQIESYPELFHGTCNEIPDKHRGKPILASVRNPFDLYVSFYYFGWWITHPEDSYEDFNRVKDEYPKFPELSFEEFVNLANKHFDDFKLIGQQNLEQEQRLGWYSTRFIMYYFKNPQDVYTKIDEAYLTSGKYRDDMHEVNFMRTHSLNQDLHDFLASIGYSEKSLECIFSMPKVRPSEEARKRPSGDWKKYYTSELRDYVLRKEKLLFHLFPDLAWD